MQLPLQDDWLWPAGFHRLLRSGRDPSGGSPSLRTYVLADHSEAHPPDRRSPCPRPGPRLHAARGRSRDPRPRRRAYAAPRIHSTCGGPRGRRSSAGTPQTQGTPRPWRSGRSTARRVPGHRRGLRVGRVLWRSIRRGGAHLDRDGRTDSATSPPGGGRSVARLPTPEVAAGVPTSLHLARGSTASLPTGCDRAGRTRLTAGRLGRDQLVGPSRHGTDLCSRGRLAGAIRGSAGADIRVGARAVWSCEGRRTGQEPVGPAGGGGRLGSADGELVGWAATGWPHCQQ